MARCGCASDVCGCNFIAGNNIAMTGNGSRSNPYVVEAVIPESSGGGTPDPGTGNGTRFPGEIVATATLSAPAGWLMCDGSQVSRVTYTDLFAAIGVGYGAGNGNTTFTLPNFVDAVPMGSGPVHARGSKSGSRTLSIGVANLPSHVHEISHPHANSTTTASGPHTHFATTTADGAHKHQLDYRNADATPNGANVAFGLTGTAAVVSDAAVLSAGTHTHTIGVGANGDHTHGTTTPSFIGNSGPAGSGTALSVDPVNQAVNYVIKY